MTLVCVGDSLTTGAVLDEDTRTFQSEFSYATALRNAAPHRRVAVLARCGALCFELERALRDAPMAPGDLVIVLAGTNDFFVTRSASAVVRGVVSIHALAHAKGARTILILPPLGFGCGAERREVVVALRAWAARNPLVKSVLDFETIVPMALRASDGVHLTIAGSVHLGCAVALAADSS